MLSFYGGQPGKSFRISKIFPNRTALEEDLSQRWYSDVGVGEMVFISYGNPNPDKIDESQQLTKEEVEALLENINYKLIDKSSEFEQWLGDVTLFRHRDFIEKGKEFLDETLSSIDPLVYYEINYGGFLYYFSYYSGSWAVTPYLLGAETTNLSSIYQQNKLIDMNNPRFRGKTFNSTLWLKVYLDSNGAIVDSSGTVQYPSLSPLTEDHNDRIITIQDVEGVQNPTASGVRNNIYGLAYVLVSAMQGETPILTANHEVVDTDVPPSVETELVDIAHPTFVFKLPQAQNIDTVNSFASSLNANEEPKIYIYNGKDETSIAQVYEARKDSTDGTTLELDGDTLVVKSTDKNKEVYECGTITEGPNTVNNPIIEFSLPRAQIMQQPTTEVIGPGVNPSLDINSEEINYPFLEFKLPRSAKMFYVDFLGEKKDYNVSTNDNVELKNLVYSNNQLKDVSVRPLIGDYFINEDTGTTYVVSNISSSASFVESTYNFEFLARLISPTPSVLTVEEAISEGIELDNDGLALVKPFDGENIVNPDVKVVNLEGNELKQRVYFELPEAPKVEFNAFFVSRDQRFPDGEPKPGTTLSLEIEQKHENDDTIVYSFEVPEGPKGDGIKFYPQTYRFDNDAASAAENGVTYLQEFSRETIIQTIKDEYNAAGRRTPNIDEAVIVNYHEGDDDTTYYFYLLDREADKWEYGTVTGGTSNLFLNTNVTTVDKTNKGYSAAFLDSILEWGDLAALREADGN